jgi:hypothetical protein
MSRAIFEQISLQANEVFKKAHAPLEPDMLICTIAEGNNCKRYKIFEINEEIGTVVIALPDMEMVTVPIDSLYHPEVAIKLFLERGDA